MTDKIYRSMSRGRYAAALKANDLPGCYTVLDEIKADHTELSAFCAMGARLVQVTEDLCKLTGADPQKELDEFACDALAVEAGPTTTPRSLAPANRRVLVAAAAVSPGSARRPMPQRRSNSVRTGCRPVSV